MLQKYLKIFKPPVFENPEKNRAAALLNNVIWISVAVNVVFGVGILVIDPMAVFPWIEFLSFNFVYAFILAWVHQGQIKTASRLMVTAIFIYVTLVEVFITGVDNRTPSNYLIPVLIAGLLIGARTGVGVAFISLGVIIGLYGFEDYGLLPIPFIGHDVVYHRLVHIVELASVSWLLYVSFYSLEVSREKTQTELTERRRSETRFRKLVDHSPGGILLVNHRGIIEEANEKAIEMFGYTVDELVGSSVEILVPGRFQKGHQHLMQNYLENPTPRIMAGGRALQCVDKESREFYAEINLIPYVISEGEKVLCFVQDVTERQLAEMETRIMLSVAIAINSVENAQEAYQSILAQLCGLTGWELGEVWIPNQDGTELVYAAEFTYYDHEKLREFSEISKEFVFPGEIGLPGRVWASKQVEWIQDVSALPVEEFLRVEHAKQLGIKATVGAPVLVSGEVVSVLVFFSTKTKEYDERMVDLVTSVASQLGMFFQRTLAIDALRESEKRLQEAQEIAQLGHWEWNMQENREIRSEAIYKILGVSPDQLGASFQAYMELVHPDDKDKVRSELNSALKNRTDYSVKYRIIRPTGEIRYIHSMGRASYGKGGLPERMVGTMQDITEQMQHQREQEIFVTVSGALRLAKTSEEMIAILLEQIETLTDAKGMDVLLLDEKQQNLICKGAGGIWAQFEGNVYPKADTISWQVIQSGSLFISNQIKSESDDLFYNSEETKLVEAVVVMPLSTTNENIGVLWVGKDIDITDEDVQIVRAICDIAGNALNRVYLYEDLETGFFEAVLALANALDVRDTSTSDHSQKMALWVELTLQSLGGTQEQINHVRLAALLHDIGKIGIPDEILHKPGPLTEEEFEIMKRHPDLGAEIVAPIRQLENVAPIIRSHQEKYDGTGYPNGLRGEEISVEAQVLCVVDAYGAMTEDRSYRKAFSSKAAAEELIRCKGADFDPDVVDAFLKVIGAFTEI